MRTHFRAAPTVAWLSVERADPSCQRAFHPGGDAPPAVDFDFAYRVLQTAHTLHRQAEQLAALFVPPANPGRPLASGQDCAEH